MSSSTQAPFNSTTQAGIGDDFNSACEAEQECQPGIIIPVWTPKARDYFTITYRAVIYGLCLAYLLLGVSIISDRIIAASVVLTSYQKTIKKKLPSGGTKTFKQKFWHPVVAAMTLGVIGTSSPEILLPVIEVIRRGFKGNNLGPMLIVGSGAYHLFVITAICLASVHSTTKSIKNLPVFFSTAFLSIFASAWVYVIVAVISPGIIELWEACVTLSMFPMLVLISWIVAKNIPKSIFKYFRSHIFKIINQRKIAVATPRNSVNGVLNFSSDEKKRQQLTKLIKKLKIENPNSSMLEIQEMAKVKFLEEENEKGTSYYRLQATMGVPGKKNVKIPEHPGSHIAAAQKLTRSFSLASQVQMVGFSAQVHFCRKGCGVTCVTVKRWGAGVRTSKLRLKFLTEEKTANYKVDFLPDSGEVIFKPGQTAVMIHFVILGNSSYDPKSKNFLVNLGNPQIDTKENKIPDENEVYEKMRWSTSIIPADNYSIHVIRAENTDKVFLAESSVNVVIIDDNHCGIFAFSSDEMTIPDNIGTAKVKVVRSIGTKGKVQLLYKVTPGTAKANSDYFAAKSKGEIIFENGQIEATIPIKIIDKDRHGEVFTFFIELLQVVSSISSSMNSIVAEARIGHKKRIQIGICEDEEMAEMLDRLIRVTDLAEYLKSINWTMQLRNALTIFHDEASQASWFSLVKTYTLHILSFPWKILMSLMPPLNLLNGFVTYILLLCIMAIVASSIGDLTSHLGCTIGLKNTVVALTLIPLGLCLPDTFASRRAAIEEDDADAAIGQITGSNAVTVFLGMGMAWTIGAGYQAARNNYLYLPPKDFAFPVILYCSFATIVVLVLLFRRLPPIRGELGGPRVARVLTASLFITLWLLFIILSTLESYCYIDPSM